MISLRKGGGVGLGSSQKNGIFRRQDAQVRSSLDSRIMPLPRLCSVVEAESVVALWILAGLIAVAVSNGVPGFVRMA